MTTVITQILLQTTVNQVRIEASRLIPVRTTWPPRKIVHLFYVPIPESDIFVGCGIPLIIFDRISEPISRISRQFTYKQGFCERCCRSDKPRRMIDKKRTETSAPRRPSSDAFSRNCPNLESIFNYFFSSITWSSDTARVVISLPPIFRQSSHISPRDNLAQFVNVSFAGSDPIEFVLSVIVALEKAHSRHIRNWDWNLETV